MGDRAWSLFTRSCGRPRSYHSYVRISVVDCCHYLRIAVGDPGPYLLVAVGDPGRYLPIAVAVGDTGHCLLINRECGLLVTLVSI